MAADPNQQQQQQAAGGLGGGLTGGANTSAGGNTQGEDYGDKGLDFLEKKTGHTLGRNTNEKITDTARGLFEKATGKQVDPKYSN